MVADSKRPWRTWRTGTETFMIIEAHPYHKAVNMVDHKQQFPVSPFRPVHRAECRRSFCAIWL